MSRKQTLLEQLDKDYNFRKILSYIVQIIKYTAYLEKNSKRIGWSFLNIRHAKLGQ